jgi:hypothetical protein
MLISSINELSLVLRIFKKHKTQLASFNANTMTSYSQENLLELLSTFCLEHNLLIKGFPEPSQYEESTYDVRRIWH